MHAVCVPAQESATSGYLVRHAGQVPSFTKRSTSLDGTRTSRPNRTVAIFLRSTHLRIQAWVTPSFSATCGTLSKLTLRLATLIPPEHANAFRRRIGAELLSLKMENNGLGFSPWRKPYLGFLRGRLLPGSDQSSDCFCVCRIGAVSAIQFDRDLAIGQPRAVEFQCFLG